MSIVRNFDVHIAHQQHVAGKSVKDVAAALGITRRCLTMRFLKNGLPWRGLSEAGKLCWALRGENKRRQMTQAAHDAVRGTKLTQEQLQKRSKSVQRAGRLSAGEMAMLSLLDRFLVTAVPLLSCGPYNIDIAVLSTRLAVEIDGGGWHQSERKKIQDAKKTQYLEDRGWHVLRVGTDRGRFVRKHLVSLAQVLGVDPSFSDDVNRMVPRKNKIPPI